MPTACSKREAKRFESKKGKSELSPADDQQARHVDTLLQARYTPNGYFYPRLPMTNKPGTLTYSGIIRRREGSIWPGEMIDHCTRNRTGLPASQHVLKELQEKRIREKGYTPTEYSPPFKMRILIRFARLGFRILSPLHRTNMRVKFGQDDPICVSCS